MPPKSTRALVPIVPRYPEPPENGPAAPIGPAAPLGPAVSLGPAAPLGAAVPLGPTAPLGSPMIMNQPPRMALWQEQDMIALLQDVPGFDFSGCEMPRGIELQALAEVLLTQCNGTLMQTPPRLMKGITYMMDVAISTRTTQNITGDYIWLRVWDAGIWPRAYLRYATPKTLELAAKIYIPAFKKGMAAAGPKGQPLITLAVTFGTWLSLVEGATYYINLRSVGGANNEVDRNGNGVWFSNDVGRAQEEVRTANAQRDEALRLQEHAVYQRDELIRENQQLKIQLADANEARRRAEDIAAELTEELENTVGPAPVD